MKKYIVINKVMVCVVMTTQNIRRHFSTQLMQRRAHTEIISQAYAFEVNFHDPSSPRLYMRSLNPSYVVTLGSFVF